MRRPGATSQPGRSGEPEEGTTLDDRIVRAIIGAVREKDRSGYEIWRWLGATHGSHGAELNEANLYPTLHRMEAQRLIRAEWDEGEKTRRLYRVAAKAAILADRHGWPPLAHPMTSDPVSEEMAQDNANATNALPSDAAEYIVRLEGALTLSDDCRSDVRNEIRDHLEDSSNGYERAGRSPEEAEKLAIRGLGSPELLASRIVKEQLTRRRLVSGSGSAIVSALFGATIGILAAGVAIFAAPLLGRVLVNAVATLGLHLYLPDTPEWHSQQIGLIAAFAAFFAARRSTPLASQWTRRSVRAIKAGWALCGAILLMTVALLLPASLDPLVAVAYLAIPVAWALGTWRCQEPGDDLISRRGVLRVAPVIALLLFLPGMRTWYFSPSTPVSAPLPAATSDASIFVDPMNNTLRVSGIDGWSDIKIEGWAAARQGLEVTPDMTRPDSVFEATPDHGFTLSDLPGSDNDWWLVLTGVGSDGARHNLGVALLPSNRPIHLQSLYGWLVGSK